MYFWHLFFIGVFFLLLPLTQAEEESSEAESALEESSETGEPKETEKENVEGEEATEENKEETPEEENPLLAEQGEIEIFSFLANADSKKQEKEWVEIKNTTEKTIDISGFSLSDEKSTFFTISQNTLLSPQEIFHAEGWGSKLNNTGDSLLLVSPSEEIFQEIIFETQKKSEVFFTAPPKIITVNTSSASQESPSLRIIQFLANAEKEKEEFADIRNFSDFPANLSGYTIWDAKGKIFSFEEGFRIAAGNSAHISGWGSKLNNGGDSILLKDASGNILDQISFGKTDKGEVCVEGNQFCSDLKEGGASFSGGGNSEIDLVQTPSHWQSPTPDDISLRISEVLFSGKEDFIELFCEHCDQDLGGIRVGDDKVFFEFPPETLVKNGEYILLHFTNKEHPSLHAKNIWYFPINRKGLTKTDETLFLLDSQGNIFDAICIANGDGKISAAEKKDLRQLINKKALLPKHRLTEEFCAKSKGISKITSLVFGGVDRGTPGKDYFWTENMTPGWKNVSPPIHGEEHNIYISSAGKIKEDLFFLVLENKGGNPLSLDSFTMEWGEEKDHFEILEEPPRLINKPFFEVQYQERGEGEIMPGEKKVIFVEKKTQSFSHIRLRDQWKKTISSTNFQEENLSSGKSMISEIFANPAGKDEGKEFLEISCPFKQCSLSNIFLINNQKHTPLPQKILSQGEKFVLHNIPLSNSNLSLEIFDPLHEHREKVEFESAKEGKSFSLLKNKREWTDAITPKTQNVFARRKEDRDHDGFEDTWEASMGLSPERNDTNNIFAQKVLQQYWKRNSTLTIEEKEEELIFSGTTLPNSFGNIVLSQENKNLSFAFSTDKEGKFSVAKTPFLEPKKYEVLLKTEKTGVISSSSFFLKKNPQKGWIQSAKIRGVLPNPQGKDKNQEIILIQSTESGVIKGASLIFREKKYPLPDIILNAGQNKILRGKGIPSLINQEGELFLKNKEGEALSHISWKNARSGEWIGEGFPRFTSVKTQKTKKKRKKERAPIVPEERKKSFQYWEGEITYLSKNILVLKKDEKNHLFFGKFSPFFRVGDMVNIKAQGQRIEDISRLLLEDSFPLGLPQKNIPQNILMLLFVSILAMGISTFGGRKIREQLY